jgi:NTP pyrophosphatase (non-canonical NTP hydrolase)
MKTVAAEVAAERTQQDARWGEQNHPLIDPILAERGARRLAEEHEIPTEARAKFLCEWATARGEVTWAHILVEEVAEVVSAAATGRLDEARAELVQVAAVAVAAIESIDRNGGVE